MSKKPHEYWYYFGRCSGKPQQIREGMLPMRPFERFDTKEECAAYIKKHKTPSLTPPWDAPKR